MKKVAQLPFLQYKCSRTAQMEAMSRKGYFSFEIAPFAYIQSLRIPEADSLKNGGKVTFLKSRLFTNVLEQCLKI
jgi:hypothetical protein